jgi:hypothetical protein
MSTPPCADPDGTLGHSELAAGATKCVIIVCTVARVGTLIEKIARLVGHTLTTINETVYCWQTCPVVVGSAEVMDSLFGVQARSLPKCRPPSGR